MQPTEDEPISAPVLLHLHIPRSSGSSLDRWFRALVGKSRVAIASSAEQVAAAAHRADHDPEAVEPAVISGHFLYGAHDELGDRPYRYVTLVRDPVARVVSIFRYARKLEAHRFHASLNEPGATIAQFYQEGRAVGSVRDGMTRQLNGIRGTAPLTPEHVDIAFKRLTAPKTILGMTEDSAPVLAACAAILGIDVYPPLPVSNVGPEQDGWVTEADLALIRKENEVDLELYGRIRDYMSARPERQLASA